MQVCYAGGAKEEAMATTRVRALDEDAPLTPAELDGLTLEEFLSLPEAKPALEYAVNPLNHIVCLIRRRYEPATLSDADEIDLDDVLPGFTITVQALFATLRLG